MPTRGVHGYKHMPFNYEMSKAIFGAKVAVFLLTGFSIPGIAAYYQMYVQVFAYGVVSVLQPPFTQLPGTTANYLEALQEARRQKWDVQ
ncbi:hypothetical protein B0F90DRAFT_1814102 [Multifurca ochricompacta]|uniref:Cytochrome c oxidase subunit 8, mitochondrial n=1 Tax=Multifurca ochricompacta TaxID=376703 RepID=A0AAD4MBZ4_9AGAM|nr:hypothetical protein B0F90DRAFT_1814102 [Multifurca ochricompacta]